MDSPCLEGGNKNAIRHTQYLCKCAGVSERNERQSRICFVVTFVGSFPLIRHSSCRNSSMAPAAGDGQFKNLHSASTWEPMRNKAK